MTASSTTERQGAVLIVDALGTRGIWARSNPEHVVRSLAGLGKAFTSGVGRATRGGRNPYSRLAKLNSFPPQDVRWHCRTISDTVIATARTDGSLGTLLLYVALEATPLLGVGFEHQHPFRGAISTGTYYESGNALIGPAVDEAADWHDKSDWAGLILTPSAVEALESVGIEMKLVGGPAYVEAQIPLKDGPIQGYALNWPLDTVPREAISRAFSRPPVAPDVARKLARTLAFYDANHA